MASKVTVYIVDDDEALRDSLCVLFRSHDMQALSFNGGADFLKEPSARSDCCALIDINMPGMSGLELLTVLNGSARKMPCIMMTGLGQVSVAVQAMKLGAIDFIEKPFDVDELVKIVQRALDQTHEPPMRSAPNSAQTALLAGLTKREKDVMAGVAKGLPNKAIAYELGISPRTVEIHRARVMQKLNAQSVADIVRLAMASGMLE
jgi:two-component system, LuxR family, response regulator FixJ